MDNFEKQINELSQNVVDLLINNNFKISTAESCTGGMLASSISNIIGSSIVFEFGVITYSDRVKNQKLNISKEILKDFGAVSQQTSELMAKNIKDISDSNVGVSITGLAGPNGDGSGKEIGTVFISVYKDGEMNTQKFIFNEKPYSRIEIKKMSTINALKMILNVL